MSYKELLNARAHLDTVIWGYKYELQEAPRLDDALRAILDELTEAIGRHREEVRDLLIQADDELTYLGVDLDRRFGAGSWDPDAYYTPLEHRLHLIAEAVGYDYNRDIAAPAYRARQERRARIEDRLREEPE